VQQDTAAAAARVQQQAKQVASTATSIDIAKMATNANVHVADRLRDSASAITSSAERLASSVGLPKSPGPGGGAPATSGGSGAVADDGKLRDGNRSLSSMEEGSDSGGDDAAWASHSSRFGSLSGVASRLGLGTGKRDTEKERLVPGHVPSGAGGAGSSVAGNGAAGIMGNLSGWAAGMSLAQAREQGLATANSIGSGLGLVSKQKEPPKGLARLCACLPSLTKGQRLLGFAVCFIFGGLLSLSALSSLPALLLGNPAPFAFKYTFGNLLSLSSSSFLVGPEKQCRDMLAPERRTASLLYLGALAGSLISVFILKWQIISFFFIVIQFCALTWYMLSYIPYGQVCLKRVVARLR
jgi:hypothetical protein